MLKRDSLSRLCTGALALASILAVASCDGTVTAEPDNASGQELTAPAKKCTGALPQICERCSDSTSQCAHFDQSCNIVICDPAPKTCTGALPQICERCSNGASQCAHFDQNCNVVICDPAPKTCTGALPQICERCADGTTQCAHFDSNCNIAICEGHTGATESTSKASGSGSASGS